MVWSSVAQRGIGEDKQFMRQTAKDTHGISNIFMNDHDKRYTCQLLPLSQLENNPYDNDEISIVICGMKRRLLAWISAPIGAMPETSSPRDGLYLGISMNEEMKEI